MKTPSTRGYLLAPESIALTDMVLNLFIFFFVSFSLLYTFSPDRLARLEVALPKAQTGQGGLSAAVVITVMRDGRYHVGDRVVSDAQLISEMSALARRRPVASVLIRADEAAPCRSLVAVFDACRAGGITQTSFAVEPAA